MNVGVASSEANPTHSYLNSRGIWLTYTLLVLVLHLLILTMPWFSVAVAWTLTNVIHNLVRFSNFVSRSSIPVCSYIVLFF